MLQTMAFFSSGKLVVKHLLAYHQLYPSLEIKTEKLKKCLFIKSFKNNSNKSIYTHINGTFYGKIEFQISARRMALFSYNLANLSNVQFNGRQLGSHICSAFNMLQYVALV